MTIRGGQGRTPESILDSAGAVLWAFGLAALLLTLILTGVI